MAFSPQSCCEGLYLIGHFFPLDAVEGVMIFGKSRLPFLHCSVATTGTTPVPSGFRPFDVPLCGSYSVRTSGDHLEGSPHLPA